MATPTTHRVLIAGGGVAGLEALIALRSIAEGLVDVTLMAPDDHFSIRALSVQAPFAMPIPRPHALRSVCTDHGASFLHDALEEVYPAERRVRTRDGEVLAYDSLLVAVGARPEPAFERVVTFRGMQDAEAMHGLVQDVERGHTRSIAFVVPAGVSWPLALYELALMIAERAASLGIEVGLSIVTHEHDPLGMFGGRASDAVDRLLSDAGIIVLTGMHVREVSQGTIRGLSGRAIAQAERVVALPLLRPVAVRGLPHDADGFLVVDAHARVHGVAGVYAAGDGTSFPIKQGGIAAQQADVAARAIAEAAGASVVPTTFRPMLRATLLTGAQPKYLREAITGGSGHGSSTASDHALWSTPGKVAAPYLAPYLERVEAGSPRAPAA